jgi:hypothetical protein
MKFYFLGLLNELEIYKDFNYFLIPKTISYTGRIFDLLYYLSLQRHKIVHGFVLLKAAKNMEINQHNFEAIKNIIKEVINNPNILTELDKVTFELYKANLITVDIQYMLSYCKQDIEGHALRTYIETCKDSKSFNLQDSIVMFNQHIKKKKNMVKVINFLYHYVYADVNVGDIYEKDATSSAFQVIAILFCDKALGTSVNLVDNKANDLYQEFLDDFKLTFDTLGIRLKSLNPIETSDGAIQFSSILENINDIKLPLNPLAKPISFNVKSDYEDYRNSKVIFKQAVEDNIRKLRELFRKFPSLSIDTLSLKDIKEFSWLNDNLLAYYAKYNAGNNKLMLYIYRYNSKSI